MFGSMRGGDRKFQLPRAVPALLLQFFALWWTLTRSAFLGWMVAVGVWLIMHLWRTRGARRPLIGLLRERWAVVILMPPSETAGTRPSASGCASQGFSRAWSLHRCCSLSST